MMVILFLVLFFGLLAAGMPIFLVLGLCAAILYIASGEPLIGVEHCDPVAHIVEGHAQLGLTPADFFEQPRIVHRNDRLSGKTLQQRDLSVGEWPHFLPVDDKISEKRIVLAQRHRD